MLFRLKCRRTFLLIADTNTRLKLGEKIARITKNIRSRFCLCLQLCFLFNQSENRVLWSHISDTSKLSSTVLSLLIWAIMRRFNWNYPKVTTLFFSLEDVCLGDQRLQFIDYSMNDKLLVDQTEKKLKQWSAKTNLSLSSTFSSERSKSCSINTNFLATWSRLIC